MSVWDELKPVLVRLRDRQPRVLESNPSTSSDEDKTPPFRIRLVPWAADVAEELHRQFGDAVTLTVGLLPYPPGRPVPHRRRREPGPAPDLLDPREVRADLDAPAVVSSGHVTRRYLIVHNLTGSELRIATNGGVTADIVDPRAGEIVGGFSGMQTLPLKVIGAAPGESARIPLLIGTASCQPRLGYTVPVGDWGIQVTLTLGPHPRDAPRRRTPVLPLTITA